MGEVLSASPIFGLQQGKRQLEQIKPQTNEDGALRCLHLFEVCQKMLEKKTRLFLFQDLVC